MARLESVAVAGYFPTPDALVPRIAARLDASAGHEAHYDAQLRMSVYPTYALLDPAAGDGAALVACAQTLFGDPLPTIGRGPQIPLYGVELEADRALALAGRVRAATPGYGRGVALHSDAFQVTWAIGPGAEGAQLLWLNPPYDQDAIHERLEQAFLLRWTAALTPGTGLLVFIVPGYALTTSAATLAAEYDDLRCYRFPDPEFSAFRQVVLLGRRRVAPLTLPGATDRLSAQIRAWAANPTILPVLPLPGDAPPDLTFAPGSQGGFTSFATHPLDVQQALQSYRPWTVGASEISSLPLLSTSNGQTPRSGQTLTPLAEVGVHQALPDFLSRQLLVAMPPKPAYLALLLAAGMLNGLRVEPDDPQAGWPPILVKGRFKKDFVTVKEHQDKKGRTTSQVQVQQPTLAVCILALTDPPRYVDLAPGTTPSAATTVEGMNIADLLQHYGHGLALLMRRQFPAQHDPTNPAHLLPLPPLARPLFTAQAHVVQSTLKLLGQGEHPLVLGEVGCGKSIISLAVAVALSPAQYATTRAALRAQSCWNRTHPPRPVRRVLVLCPPHLVSSWTEQVRLTLPGASVVPVRQIADLHAPPPPTGAGPGTGLSIYLLTRETAKLGHAWRAGLAARATCPKCGTPTTETPERIVSKRLRCRHQPLHAGHPVGAVAHALARLLLPVDPADDMLRTLVPERYIR